MFHCKNASSARKLHGSIERRSDDSVTAKKWVRLDLFTISRDSLSPALPSDDGHWQFQPDIIRSRADEKFIFPRFNHVLFFVRVPATQAFGGNCNCDFAGFALIQMHTGKSAQREFRLRNVGVN